MSEKSLATTTSDAPAVYQPPASFEVLDRGAAEVFKFNAIGDSFVGMFDELRDMTDTEGEHFEQAIFMGADGRNYCIFPGASLVRALHKLTRGDWVRITYDQDIDTGRPTPMKSYVVERGLA